MTVDNIRAAYGLYKSPESCWPVNVKGKTKNTVEPPVGDHSVFCILGGRLPQEASSEKRSSHIYFMEDNLKACNV